MTPTSLTDDDIRTELTAGSLVNSAEDGTDTAADPSDADGTDGTSDADGADGTDGTDGADADGTDDAS
jgi:hypothetical protein